MMDSLIELEPSEAKARLEYRLSRRMLKTVGDYALISAGDVIMVAVSGGKDSYSLLQLLLLAQKKAPIEFRLVAYHLDQAQPGYDGKPLKEWLDAHEVPFEIHQEDTYSTVIEATKPGEAYCRVCSRLRRGILYRAAERLGCNKIALGHHRDDALETLWLNMMFAGKIQAMPASYTTNDHRFEVIRPLIECDEQTIADYAALAKFPILPCNLCGSQEGLKRKQVKQWLIDLEEKIPNVRSVMAAALKNVRPSHLLDREVCTAWERMASEFEPRR